MLQENYETVPELAPTIPNILVHYTQVQIVDPLNDSEICILRW